jgi:site-specific DNA recombinase
MIKHAVGYVRCSSEEQRVNGISLEVQEAKLRAWATLHDVTITIEVDAGISGKSTHNRPALKRCLAAMRPGAILVTCDLSRLSRRTIDALQIAELLAKRGAELVSLKEQIPAGPAGKLILAVLASLAEIERDQVSTRTKAAMSYLADQGRYLGGRAPYGYQLAEDGETLAEVPDEQSVIAEVRAIRSASPSISLRTIANMLGERGVLSRSGKAFAPSTIAAMLIERPTSTAVAA